jgi:hypothetical protein
MSRKAIIISDGAKAQAPAQGSDQRDDAVHHRYYGSSALNGGERIVESRRGQRPRTVNVCGF